MSQLTVDGYVDGVVGLVVGKDFHIVTVAEGPFNGTGSVSVDVNQLISAIESNVLIDQRGILVTYPSLDTVKVYATEIIKGVYTVFDRDLLLKYLKSKK